MEDKKIQIFDEFLTFDYVEKLQLDVMRLEKALDKACGQIAWLWNDYQCDQGSWDIKEWKEWCMSDDQY